MAIMTTNKITVFEFVTMFNSFYVNALHIIEDSYNSEHTPHCYIDKVYDVITEYKNEVERTLESRVLSVEKASNMLYNELEVVVKIAENCIENYNFFNDESSFEAYKFLNSIIDCYNEMCEEING